MAAKPFLPLAGVRIIDLTTNMSGPLATMVLAEQGADVVKVEPVAGDLIRTIGTGRGGMSAYFANLNRGKRSIAIDLATPAGRDLVLRLSDGADVFVQNFRPGVVERLGVGPDDVMARNDALIYASISGFGLDGPLATAPAYDHVVQALAGFCALQGDDEQASMVKQGVIDKATSYTLAQAVTAALLPRTSTGRGLRIDVSMLDVALAYLWPDGMMNNTVIDPEKVLPPVARSFRVTPTADGFVALVTLTAEPVGRAGRGARRSRRRTPTGPTTPTPPPAWSSGADHHARGPAQDRHHAPPPRSSSAWPGPTCPARRCWPSTSCTSIRRSWPRARSSRSTTPPWAPSASRSRPPASTRPSPRSARLRRAPARTAARSCSRPGSTSGPSTS